MESNQNPYIEVTTSTTKMQYNPHYGDDRVCECGHRYYRHFDSYENNAAVGCKYCQCRTFSEASLQPEKVTVDARAVRDYNHIGICDADHQTAGIILPSEYVEDFARDMHFVRKLIADMPGREHDLARLDNFFNICRDFHRAVAGEEFPLFDGLPQLTK